MTIETSYADRREHARAMDRTYRWQRHIYDATRKYYLIGRDGMIDGLDARPGMSVLELGCGTGRNMVVAARRHPGARFYGVDISAQMLTSAVRSAGRAGLADRIATAPGDAETIDAAKRFDVAGFDRVMLPYCLSMIPGWRRAIANAIAQTAPGGSVHIVDFGHMGRWPDLARKLMRLWLARFRVEPRRDLVGTVERVAAEHGCRARARCILGGYAWAIVVEKPGDEGRGTEP